MANESSPSREELDDRIAVLRDNIRQLTNRRPPPRAADETRNSDRIAEQDAELQRLIKQRDALGKR